MDSKIPTHFWSDDRLSTPELLLAAAWLRTHSGINLAGYAEISVRRFVFETRLPEEALGRVAEALGKGLVCEGNGYWLRDFIADEFGRGQQLAANNMSAAVVRALDSIKSPWVALAVLEEYPELNNRWNTLQQWKGLGRLTPRAKAQGVRVREGVRAGVGASAGGSVDADAIYLAYPKHVGKQDALKAITAVLREKDPAWLLGRVTAYATAVAQWPAERREFVPHPATWFRRGNFDDDPSTWVSGKNSVNGKSSAEAPFNPKAENAHTGGAVAVN